MSNFPPLPRGVSATYTASEMFEFAEKTHALRERGVYEAGRRSVQVERSVYESFAEESRMHEARRRADEAVWANGGGG